METQSKKKPGRNKQKSPPYQQTEQLVRTALNQGMLAKEIAVLCRVNASIINKWKNGLVKAQTHVIAPLIERFGHAVNRHQLHHFSHVDPADFHKKKLTEIRGTLIFNWDIKEIYDVDERSLFTKRYNETFKVPRFKDFTTNKIYLFYRKPDKFIVANLKPCLPVSTFQEKHGFDSTPMQAHISTPIPDVLETSIYPNTHECLEALHLLLTTIETKAVDWTTNQDNRHNTDKYKECYLISKTDLTAYHVPISLYYTKQLQDAARTLFRQCRLHGFIETNEFLSKEIEVI
ncbi:MAG: hypothetical protein HRT35_06145 [Algicola sp.]|nr:hypothetical protein [Algicola sp.]